MAAGGGGGCGQEEEVALFRVQHDDGDVEDLEEGEARAAAEWHASLLQEKAMRADGHRWVGQRVARYFEQRAAPVLCSITKWLPPDGDEGALFRCVHDDGDEEDLWEGEAREAVADYKALLQLGRQGRAS